MANQQDIGFCPETGHKIVGFEIAASKWGMARYDPGMGGHFYYGKDRQWITSNGQDVITIFASLAEALRGFQDYTRKLIASAVRPIQISKDVSGQHPVFKFRCPSCSLHHISVAKFNTWNEVHQVLRRFCPKDPNKEKNILVHMWDLKVDGKTSVKQPTAPVAPFERIPQYECKECFATGEYVAFTTVDQCSTCFPKPKPC